MRRDIMRRPIVPLDMTEANKEIAVHNELLIDEDNMLWIKRHDNETGKDDFIALWRIAVGMLSENLPHLCGCVDSYADLLELEDVKAGDIYIVAVDETQAEENNKYMEYMWVKQKDGSYIWENLGNPSVTHHSIIDILDEEPTDPAEGYCWLVRKK